MKTLTILLAVLFILALPCLALAEARGEFSKEDQFISIAYKKDWALIRKIDETNGVAYDCR